ncbi:hypothetical protein BD626DRAFT_54210 [Schizophyllum amplum]|uniref:Uncharacterized protein n=1 Tax=Schizophyllum amplum TaxID=97359 RepID=A0A550CD84_9AGAR|nr:hypothetical protein BD626DRAFT_54210 [Auriculariopsis ampla]
MGRIKHQHGMAWVERGCVDAEKRAHEDMYTHSTNASGRSDDRAEGEWRIHLLSRLAPSNRPSFAHGRRMLNDWFGCALRGGSGLGVDFADTDACALRLLDRLDPSLFSSGNPRKFVCTADAEADAGVAMGEYSRPCDVLEDDGSEETCSRIANSVVAFVSCTIFARKVPDRAWGRRTF